MSRPDKSEPIREAVQGFACQCKHCVTPPDGLMASEIWCAQCGHGYIDLRTGRADDARMGCQKCGAVGQFVESKPLLPMPPRRQYRIEVTRMIEQTSELICVGVSPFEAVDRALEYAKSGLSWKGDRIVGVEFPRTVTALDVVGVSL